MAMILYGGGLSPFVRRVAIWLALHGQAFERRAITVLAPDFGGIRSVNPVGRVPVLTLPTGQHLVETFAIIDHLETIASAAKRLIPSDGPERLAVMQVIAHANGIAEKGVALVYETIKRPSPFQWPDWQNRLGEQIEGAISTLETLTPAEGWLGGTQPNGADIALVCAHDFIAVAHPRFALGETSNLAALSRRANAIAVFRDTYPVMI